MKAKLDDANKYDVDQLLNVLDMIWDYYEQNGLLDIDIDDDSSEENILDDLVEYVTRMVKKDRQAIIEPSDIPMLVEGELEYEDQLARDQFN